MCDSVRWEDFNNLRLETLQGDTSYITCGAIKLFEFSPLKILHLKQ